MVVIVGVDVDADGAEVVDDDPKGEPLGLGAVTDTVDCEGGVEDEEGEGEGTAFDVVLGNGFIGPGPRPFDVEVLGPVGEEPEEEGNGRDGPVFPSSVNRIEIKIKSKGCHNRNAVHKQREWGMRDAGRGSGSKRSNQYSSTHRHHSNILLQVLQIHSPNPQSDTVHPR